MRLTALGDVQCVIATARPNILARCHLGLQLQGATIAVGGYDALQAALAQLHPRLVLLDLELPGLNVQRQIAELTRLHSHARIIALSDFFTSDKELDLFISGVWCCCSSEIDPQQLKRIVEAVKRGELWIRRAFISQLRDALRVHQQFNGLDDSLVARRVEGLTAREQEIARLIGKGHSNKHIARLLRITDRTVKGHLTQIFRKLGVTDRLMLALHIAKDPDKKPVLDDVDAWAPVFQATNTTALGPVAETGEQSRPLTGT